VSTPLHVIIFFSSYFLNVLLQIANKNGIKKNSARIYCLSFVASTSVFVEVEWGSSSVLFNVSQWHKNISQFGV
jgi:hypothetical protein